MADLGNWIEVKDMALTDTSPLPAEYDDLLAIGLAIRLGPRYGRGISRETVARFTQLISRLQAKYKQIVMQPNNNNQPFLSPGTGGHNGGDVDGSLFK